MRVTTPDGRQYGIEWEHGRTSDGDDWTACRIRQKLEVPALDTDTEAWTLVADSHVVRYYKDTPNRDVARKESLANALFNFTDTHSDGYRADPKNKAIRKLFWDVFSARKAPRTAVQP